jgi:hypothetical protein
MLLPSTSFWSRCRLVDEPHEMAAQFVANALIMAMPRSETRLHIDVPSKKKVHVAAIAARGVFQLGKRHCRPQQLRLSAYPIVGFQITEAD